MSGAGRAAVLARLGARLALDTTGCSGVADPTRPATQRSDSTLVRAPRLLTPHSTLALAPFCALGRKMPPQLADMRRRPHSLTLTATPCLAQSLPARCQWCCP